MDVNEWWLWWEQEVSFLLQVVSELNEERKGRRSVSEFEIGIRPRSDQSGMTGRSI